jgi:signal transduction histidine kinase
MVLEAYRASRGVAQIQDLSNQIRKEMMQRDDILDRLRNDLFRSSVEVRDYLVDSDAQQVSAQRAELRTQQEQISSTFEQLSAGLAPEQAASALELQIGLNSYLTVLAKTLQLNPEDRRTRANSILQQEIIPRRRNLTELINQIVSIDTKQMSAGQEQIQAVTADFANRLREGSLAIVGIGLLIGIASMWQILRLERIAEQRYGDVVRARRDLRLLNTRLMAAEEEERKKIARELHDQVGQQLSTALVELANAGSNPADVNADRHQRMVKVRQLLERCIAQIRDLALLLRPTMLDDLGLVSALRWHGREVFRRTGVRIEVTTEGVIDDLPADFCTCIYRVVQEAITNAVRHASPTVIRVTARQHAEEIEVAIRDDGSGFDSKQERGLGIIGMQERVQGLGGVLDISSDSPSGTIVAMLLPLSQHIAAGEAE